MEELLQFASKIGTNYAATNEEAEKITASLAGPISKAKQLQEEIACVKAHYDDLVEQHLALSREIEAHQALTAPMRRVPVDILQEIFLHCLPTKHNAVISSMECPILLTRICSGWRHIALNTPMLWASIHVPIPVCSTSQCHSPRSPSLVRGTPEFELSMAIAIRQATAIREWFGRSGECVLAISIYDEDYRTPDEIYTVILDALIPFRTRWGALRCQTPAWSIMRLAAIPASELPCLHTVSFSGSSAYGTRMLELSEQEGITRWANSGILRAPRLHAITYNSITEDFTSFPLRREQLTSITLSGIGWNVTDTISIARLVNLLAECPRLRRCDLDIAPMLQPYNYDVSEDISELAAPSTGPPIKPIVLLHLTHFGIKAGRSNLAILFDALDVPALVQLEVQANFIVAASLHALLRRTAYTLRALSLDPQIFSRHEFFTCLEICANLTELRLQRSYYRPHQTWPPPAANQDDRADENIRTPTQLDDRFLHDLFIPASDTGTVLIPRLTTFECLTLGNFSDTGVLKALRARSAAASREGSVALLSYVLISFGRPQKEPMAQALEELGEAGLECVLLYTSDIPPRKHAATDGIVEFSTVGPWSVPIL